MSTATQKSSFAYYIHFIIIAFFAFGFGLIPPVEPITQKGMVLLGCFIGAIYGWSTIGIIWPSIIAILGMSLTLGMSTVLTAGFGSNICWMVIFTYFIIGLMEETKLMETIAAFLLTRKFCQGKPWIQFGFILFSSQIIGTIGGFASLMLFLTLFFNIAKLLNIPPYSKFVVISCFGVLFTHVFGMIAFPFLGNALIFISIWQSMGGAEIDFVHYMISSFSMIIVAFFTFILVCRFIIRLDLSPMKNFRIEDLGISSIKFTPMQKYASIAVIWMMIDLLLPSILPDDWAIVRFLTAITNFGQVALPIVVFMVLRHNGEPIIDFRKNTKYVSWDVILIIGTILPLATYLTADDTGISSFMVNLIQPLISAGLNPFVCILIIMFIAAVITNFANNTVVAVICMPIILTIASIDSSLSSQAGFFILVFMSHLAILTPSACPFAAVMFGNSNWIDIKSSFKYGLIIFIFSFIVMFPVGYALASVLL